MLEASGQQGLELIRKRQRHRLVGGECRVGPPCAFLVGCADADPISLRLCTDDNDADDTRLVDQQAFDGQPVREPSGQIDKRIHAVFLRQWEKRFGGQYAGSQCDLDERCAGVAGLR